MNSVRLDAVSKVFGAHQALASIDLCVGAGERTAILGPSGAGKTTMLRIIAGLVQPTAGKVYFDQREMSQFPPVDRNVAMVFQDYAVYPQLSVAENLRASLRKSRLTSSESTRRIAEALDWFRLTPYAQRRPGQLSGGQLQRVALAKAVIRRPAVMLLDEPFSQLDMQLREQLRQLLLEIHERFPATMLIVTHDPMDAMRIASTIAVMVAGRINAKGTCNEVYRQPTSRIAANLISPLGVNWLKLTLSAGDSASNSIPVTKELLLGKGSWSQNESPLAWNLSQTLAEKLLDQLAGDSHGQAVWLGFRPEAIRLVSLDAEAHAAHGLSLRGTIKSVQSLGFANLATIQSKLFQVKSLISGSIGSLPETVACEIHEEDLMCFAASADELQSR